jgi:site-specific DNA recombinase
VIVALGKEAAAAQERLRRLHRLVEDGLAATDDILKDRITALRADRDRTLSAVERANSGILSGAPIVSMT